MINRRLLTDAPEALAEALARRGPGAEHIDLPRLVETAHERKRAIQEFEGLRAEQHRRQATMKSVAKGSDEFKALITELKTLSASVKEAEATRKAAEEAFDHSLLYVPNPPDPEVPTGITEEDNVEVRLGGPEPVVHPWAESHDVAGQRLGILDFASAAKISGARFSLMVGLGARLERALMQYFLDVHADQHGYQEVLPPFLVLRHAMEGTGQLPKFEEDAFKTQDPELFLVPTAEVPVTNIHAGEILEERLLPKGYVAYTPCFRREAGSYGKDTKGLIRLHQFNKVELVWFTRPEQSEEIHQRLVSHVETVLANLELPHRVIDLCGGDLGFAAARCFDVEVFLPSQGRYREISSCSNFRDFQARRANIRYRPEDGTKPRLLHTLNGSGVAIGRCVAAILENHLEEDGSVTIPPVLRPYMGGRERIVSEG